MIVDAGIRNFLCRTLKLCILIFLFSISHNVYCFKLRTPRVLLSYNKGIPSNFTLEVTGTMPGECFEWNSSNPKIVRVTPLFSAPNCSTKAVLSCVANLIERKVTEVSVKGGGQTLYCDVITDSVASIELRYLTNELFLDGPPEKISVIAKGKEGHAFTSINGLEVIWKITNEEEIEDDVVRTSKFDTSDYESPEEAISLEERGLLSSSILVEPLQLGTAIIKASLLFSAVPVLETEELKLKVLPNLKITPSTPLYLLRHASANLRLEKLKKNEGENLGDFTAEVEDSSICSVSDLSLHAKEYGHTSVKLNPLNDNYRKTEFDVHVVKLARIGIFFSNGGYNILEEMKLYEVSLDLFDDMGNNIFASDNLRFSVSFPTKLFHVVHTSNNGTYSVLQTVAPGNGKIRVQFKGVVMEDDSISKEVLISSSLDVTVCQKITIYPHNILLPVLPRKPMHRVPLHITGGTRKYVWSLSNSSVANIVEESEKDIYVEIFGDIYDLTVRVTDKSNINIVGSAKISVQVPLDIEAYPSVTESEIGNVLIIPLALHGFEDKEKNIVKKFDDCSDGEISVHVVEKHILAYEEESDVPAFGQGCKTLQFRCRMAGHSRINMEYYVNKNTTLKTTAVVACFKPLKPVHPVRVAVLSLGSAIDVAFDGGPRKWVLHKESHFTELEASDSEIVAIKLIKDPVRYNKDLTVFRVTCLKLGETSLSFKIGNKPSATLKHPAKEASSIKIFCSAPHSLHLKLFKKKSKRVLKDENIVKVPFYGDKMFSVDIYAKDEMGRRFANISSLRVAWDVSDKSLALPASNFDFVTHENAVAGYRKLSRNFQEFNMQGPAGDLKIEAKVTSYNTKVLENEGISEYKEIEEISTSIDLKLVSLRDINAGLYDAEEEKKDEEDGYCENDSCKS